jgi:hypothetical protein
LIAERLDILERYRKSDVFGDSLDSKNIKLIEVPCGAEILNAINLLAPEPRFQEFNVSKITLLSAWEAAKWEPPSALLQLPNKRETGYLQSGAQPLDGVFPAKTLEYFAIRTGWPALGAESSDLLLL